MSSVLDVLPPFRSALATTVPAVLLGLLLAAHVPLRAQVAAPDQQTEAIEVALFRAFPEADAYRCIRRDVDQSARRTIERMLPFKLHFNELGEHCLFVALRGRRPVGLVYLRTEEAEWGLTDIAWYVTLDLRVLGFEFVRGRNRHMRTLERSALALALAGLDLEGVKALITARAAERPEQAPDGLDALATVTLRSAAKTLAVTETVWSREIEKLHDTATGYDLFPAAARFTRRTTSFELDDGGEQQTVGVKVVYAYDMGETLLGCVIWTESRFGKRPLSLRCVVDRELRVVEASPLVQDANVALRKACSSLAGSPLTNPAEQDNPLAPLARGLGVVIPRLTERRRRR